MLVIPCFLVHSLRFLFVSVMYKSIQILITIIVGILCSFLGTYLYFCVYKKIFTCFNIKQNKTNNFPLSVYCCSASIQPLSERSVLVPVTLRPPSQKTARYTLIS